MDQLTNKQVKTRKPHNCWGCAREYPAGTEMQLVESVDQGEFYRAYWCKECLSLFAYIPTYMDDDGWAYGELREYYEEYSK